MKTKRRAFENAGHSRTPIMQKADAPVESVGFRASHPSVSRQTFTPIRSVSDVTPAPTIPLLTTVAAMCVPWY